MEAHLLSDLVWRDNFSFTEEQVETIRPIFNRYLDSIVESDLVVYNTKSNLPGKILTRKTAEVTQAKDYITNMTTKALSNWSEVFYNTLIIKELLQELITFTNGLNYDTSIYYFSFLMNV